MTDRERKWEVDKIKICGNDVYLSDTSYKHILIGRFSVIGDKTFIPSSRLESRKKLIKELDKRYTKKK